MLTWRILVLVCGVPVLAIAAEPGTLDSRDLEVLIRSEGEISHGGFLPWSAYGLPMLAGFLAEEQLASAIDREGSRTTAHATLRRLFVWQCGAYCGRFRIHHSGTRLHRDGFGYRAHGKFRVDTRELGCAEFDITDLCHETGRGDLQPIFAGLKRADREAAGAIGESLTMEVSCSLVQRDLCVRN